MKQNHTPQASTTKDVPKLRYADVPSSWAVCPNDACPRACECLRHRVYTLTPPTEKQRLCVMPQAWQDGDCTEFAQDSPVLLAWGMKTIFSDIPSWQAAVIRRELIRLFGAERTYYRYRRGEYVITPERQQDIAELFARHGITAPRHYDYAFLSYYFRAPGFGSLHASTDERTLQRLEEWKKKHRG